MPDVYGFDHLPTRGDVQVRCVEEGCTMGGSIAQWRVSVRYAHARMHERERKNAARKREIERQREATARLRVISRLRKEARSA